MSDARGIEEEQDLRKVPYPYLCKCGWWKRYKERTPVKGDVELELDHICQRISIFEAVLRDDLTEVALKQWTDEIEKLKKLRSMLLYRHGFMPYKQHEPSKVERADFPVAEDPYPRYRVSAIDPKLRPLIEQRLGLSLSPCHRKGDFRQGVHGYIEGEFFDSISEDDFEAILNCRYDMSSRRRQVEMHVKHKPEGEIKEYEIVAGAPPHQTMELAAVYFKDHHEGLIWDEDFVRFGLKKDESQIPPRNARCFVCLGSIDSKSSWVECSCGRIYHKVCANRIKVCPMDGKQIYSALDHRIEAEIRTRFVLRTGDKVRVIPRIGNMSRGMVVVERKGNELVVSDDYKDKIGTVIKTDFYNPLDENGTFNYALVSFESEPIVEIFLCNLERVVEKSAIDPKLRPMIELRLGLLQKRKGVYRKVTPFSEAEVFDSITREDFEVILNYRYDMSGVKEHKGAFEEAWYLSPYETHYRKSNQRMVALYDPRKGLGLIWKEETVELLKKEAYGALDPRIRDKISHWFGKDFGFEKKDFEDILSNLPIGAEVKVRLHHWKYSKTLMLHSVKVSNEPPHRKRFIFKNKRGLRYVFSHLDVAGLEVKMVPVSSPSISHPLDFIRGLLN